MKDYIKQAQDFLDSTGTTLTLEYVGRKLYFDGDEKPRDVYNFTLTRGEVSYTSTFGQSLNNTGTTPSAYDVLTCLRPDEPETIDELISDFGYEIKSEKDFRNLERLAHELKRQNEGLHNLYSDEELNELGEIS